MLLGLYYENTYITTKNYVEGKLGVSPHYSGFQPKRNIVHVSSKTLRFLVRQQGQLSSHASEL